MAEVFAGEHLLVRRGTRHLLDDLSWTVNEGERWVVIGPNGAGKTTLLLLMTGRMFPTRGTVRLLGEQLGRTDIAELRTRIGWASSELVQDMPPEESVADVVLTGAYAILGRWNETYDELDEARRDRMLVEWNLEHLRAQPFWTLSEGERKRALIARALMSDPEILLLDEPGAGLDLGGREDLLHRLSRLSQTDDAPAIVMITHHVEEIPEGMTHALLIREGRIVAAGPIREVLTGRNVSATFGMPIAVSTTHGRWFAHSTSWVSS